MDANLNTALYPCSYRMSLGWAGLMITFGTAASLGGAWGLVHLVSHREASPAPELMGAIFAAIAIFGVYAICSVLRFRVTLFSDRIEVRELLTDRLMLRSQIRGYRYFRGQNSPGFFELIPRGDGSKISIARVIDLDQPFLSWIGTLPDLDAKDFAKSGAKLLDSVPGEERGARSAMVSESRKISKVLSFATFGVAALGLWYPHPYIFILLTLTFLPWMALALTFRSRGIFSIDQVRNDARPTLVTPFLLPGLVLFLRALTDFHVLDWKAAVPLSLVVGFVLWITAIAADASVYARKASLISFLLLSPAYGYGATMEFNCVFDRSKAERSPVTVLEKYTSRGSRRVAFELQVTPWGPFESENEISVSSQFYRLVEIGNTVCIEVRPGLAAIEWFKPERCP